MFWLSLRGHIMVYLQKGIRTHNDGNYFRLLLCSLSLATGPREVWRPAAVGCSGSYTPGLGNSQSRKHKLSFHNGSFKEEVPKKVLSYGTPEPRHLSEVLPRFVSELVFGGTVGVEGVGFRVQGLGLRV